MSDGARTGVIGREQNRQKNPPVFRGPFFPWGYSSRKARTALHPRLPAWPGRPEKWRNSQSATLSATENYGYILPIKNKINRTTSIKPTPPLGP